MYTITIRYPLVLGFGLILMSLTTVPMGYAQTNTPPEQFAVDISGPAKLKLSFSTGFHLEGGRVLEEVYENQIIKSRLNWQIPPTVRLPFTLELDVYHGFFLEAKGSFMLTSPEGLIFNTDYLNGNGTKTHYSQHVSTLHENSSLNVTAGMHIEFSPFLGLKPYIGIQYHRYHWNARDGYLQYPPVNSAPYPDWSDTLAISYVEGEVLEYQLNLYEFLLGVGLTIKPYNGLEIIPAVTLSPLVHAAAVDDHVKRRLRFYDTISNAILVEPALTARLLVDDRTFLQLTMNYRGLLDSGKGVTEIEDTLSGQRYMLPSRVAPEVDLSVFSLGLQIGFLLHK